MGGWVVRVGGEGAYPDFVVTSCHVRVAMGLVAPLLRIGAWSGVKHLDGMAHLVCLRYSGCPLCVVCIYIGACVFLCEYVLLCMVSQFQLPKQIPIKHG